LPAQVIPFPSRLGRRATPPGAELVTVEHDPIRGVYVAACARCAEHAVTFTLAAACRWAESHRCDPELAALLGGLAGRAA
jgi:hypothetical protein